MTRSALLWTQIADKLEHVAETIEKLVIKHQYAKRTISFRTVDAL